MSDTLAAFDAYTDRLVTWARSDDRVLGIALLGSGADRGRIDEWSDHDIAVVVDAAAVEELRGTTDWIPDASSLAVVGREWHDGFKALFADGRVIEYAVTDLDGLATFPVAAALIAYDGGGVAPAVDRARAATRPRAVSPPETLAAVLLVQIVVGVGRVRRGERLSGGDVIRSEAVATLLDLMIAVLHPASRPDPFDAFRRFEQVDADSAARLERELAQPSEDAARGILDLAEDVLGTAWPAWPVEAAAVVRRRFGWT